MLDWLKSMVVPPQPAGPPMTLKSFTATDDPISELPAVEDDGSWCIECPGDVAIPLFEIDGPEVENCMLTYRADLKTEEAGGKVYLEMWCRFPGRGEFFSKGFDQALKGSNDWGSYQVPFFLKTGQRPDLIKLNLASEGKARVWVRNLELLHASYD